MGCEIPPTLFCQKRHEGKKKILFWQMEWHKEKE